MYVIFSGWIVGQNLDGGHVLDMFLIVYRK